MRKLRRLIGILAMAICPSVNTAAQEIAGSIRGTILDASGGAVSGARVSAIQTETGLLRTAATDSQGAYVLVELLVGHYRLEAQAKGFKKYVQEGIVLDVHETATVIVRLAVGIPTEEVRVEADAGSAARAACAVGPEIRLLSTAIRPSVEMCALSRPLLRKVSVKTSRCARHGRFQCGLIGSYIRNSTPS